MEALFPILIAIIIVIVFGILLSLILNGKSRGGRGVKKQKERQTIIKEATKKLTSDPHNINALTELGSVYYKERDWQKAYPLYATLVSLASTRVGINLAEVTLKHGICALYLSKQPEALKSLLESRKLNPDNFDVNFYLGKALVEQKEFDKAKEITVS